MQRAWSRIALDARSGASNPPLHVLITGACGQIAYSLIFMIMKGSVFGRYQKIVLHLLDIPVAAPALKGILMELEDSAFPNLAGIFPSFLLFFLFLKINSDFFLIFSKFHHYQHTCTQNVQ